MNNYERQLDEALKAWEESEQHLQLLRIDTGNRTELTQKEKMEWYRNLHRSASTTTT